MFHSKLGTLKRSLGGLMGKPSGLPNKGEQLSYCLCVVVFFNLCEFAPESKKLENNISYVLLQIVLCSFLLGK